jgi:hypothetical protein
MELSTTEKYINFLHNIIDLDCSCNQGDEFGEDESQSPISLALGSHESTPMDQTLDQDVNSVKRLLVLISNVTNENIASDFVMFFKIFHRGISISNE